MFFIANWKMSLSYSQSITLASLIAYYVNNEKNKQKEIILCPSFTALDAVGTILKNTPCKLGAQNCATQPFPAALTGEVSVKDLGALNCSYCIIGHSERRELFHESNELIVKKLILLLQTGITPIICIGETREEKEKKITFSILEQQLKSLREVISQNFSSLKTRDILIAYEPRWAIGTGLVPLPSELTSIFSWLHLFLAEHQLPINYYLLYGGSVSSVTVKNLITIPHLQGFLIGKSSLDFEELKKIVDYERLDN